MLFRSGPAALVTTGAGKYYSTGLDLGVIGGDPAGLPAYVSRVQRLYARLLRLETPTVAAVNGHAFAGGAMLTLCHDHRIMGPSGSGVRRSGSPVMR